MSYFFLPKRPFLSFLRLPLASIVEAGLVGVVGVAGGAAADFNSRVPLVDALKVGVGTPATLALMSIAAPSAPFCTEKTALIHSLYCNVKWFVCARLKPR